MIIAFFGKKGVGKTTAANYLRDIHGFQKFSFADDLKEMIVKAGLCTPEEMKSKPPFVRTYLQKIGTDIFRKQVDGDFWVRKARPKLQELINSYNFTVIDDLRFPNEVTLLEEFKPVYFVEILRPIEGDYDWHISEQFSMSTPFVIMNDSHIETFLAKIDEVTKPLLRNLIRFDIEYVCNAILNFHGNGCCCTACNKAKSIREEIAFQKHLNNFTGGKE